MATTATKTMATPHTVGLLVVSTTAAKDAASDSSARLLRDLFASETTAAGGKPGKPTWAVTKIRIVSDDYDEIQTSVRKWADVDHLHLIVTTGGTGFAASDITPEAVGPLLDKEASGLVHAMLSASLAVTPFAMMARPVAGVRNRSVVVTVPGSPKGACENVQAILALLPHACAQAADLAPSRALHAGGVAKLEKDLANAPKSAVKDVVGSAAGSAAGSTAESAPGLAADSAADSAADDGHHHHHRHHHKHDHDHGHDHGHGHGHGHGGHGAPRPRTTPEQRANRLDGSVAQRHRESPYPMISVAEAKAIVTEATARLPVVDVPVDEHLVGYVLARDVAAAEAVPAYRASIVDGYAVHHTDGPGVYPVVSVLHAAPASGSAASLAAPLAPGQVARITTGAPLPPGATAVVMVEDTVLRATTADGAEEASVEVLAAGLAAGENVREVGSDVAAGAIVLRAGQCIGAVGGDVGLLAAVGVASVGVYAKPVVGVLSTGDEVVPHTRPGVLRPGQIRDSNRPSLLTALAAAGFPAVDLGIAPDTPATALTSLLRDALARVDVVVTTGGVSMGERDLLKPTIEQALGGSVRFGRVAMKPGKPTTFATVGGGGDAAAKHVFALPGNPASALVTFHLLVLPSLRKAAGYDAYELPTVKAVAEEDFSLDPRPEFQRVVVRMRPDSSGTLGARSTGGQRSSRIASAAAGANGVAVLPARSPALVGDKRAARGIIPRGEIVDVILWGQIVGL